MSEEKIPADTGNPTANMASREWTLDSELGLLRDGSGKEYRLEPRLSRLMAVFLENSGRTVSRRKLIDKTWPDSLVNEESLTRAVADLRKFLRKNCTVMPVIETASKQGYRLILPQISYPPLRPVNPWWRTTLRIVTYSLGTAAVLIILVRALSY